MTDRFAGFVVTLEQDLREDDARATIAAIKQIRGVVDVDPVHLTAEIHIANARAQREIEGKILDVLFGRMNK